MQCAAVTSRSRPGLATTLAVQKWFPLASRRNSAPTRADAGTMRAPGVRAVASRSPRQAWAPSSRLTVQYPAPPARSLTATSLALGPAAVPLALVPAAVPLALVPAAVPLVLGAAGAVVLRDRGAALPTRTAAGPGDPQPASVIAVRVAAASAAPVIRSLIGIPRLCCFLPWRPAALLSAEASSCPP